MANDPDADRLAIAEYVENAWKIFNGNEIGTLLAWWQLQVHNKKFGDDETQNQSNLIFIGNPNINVFFQPLGSAVVNF